MLPAQGLLLRLLAPATSTPLALAAYSREISAGGLCCTDVCQAAQNGKHKPLSSGAGIGPRLSQRPKGRIGIGNLFRDAE